MSTGGPAAPPPRDFYRRAYHGSVVLGDFVYIDHGTVTSGSPEETPTNYLINNTVSIPLHRSWTNQSVVPNVFTASGGPGLLDTTFLVNRKDGTAYRIGGQAIASSGDFSVRFGPYFWKLTPDHSGGGEWLAQDSPPMLEPSPHLGSVASSESTGYYILGSINTESFNPYPLAFDFASEQWKTIPNPIGNTGRSEEAALVNVPANNADGTPLMFGGIEFTDWNTDNQASTPSSLDNVTIYDPVTAKWLWQTTSGEIPIPRGKFCYVTARGSRGSTEIFIYGGSNTDFNDPSVEPSNYGDMHVLSIPAFRWFSVPNSMSDARYSHSCELVGNRQMLVIGGLGDDDSEPDPLTQGLGIFDLTLLEWKSQYEPDADSYETPKMVQDWYSKATSNSVRWASDAVQELFIPEGTNVNPFGLPPAPSSTSNSQTPSPNSDVGSDSGTNTAAIAGGAVGGSIAFLLLLGIGLFLFFRRRRKPDLVDDQGQKAELPANHISEGAMAAMRKHELDHNARPELGQGNVVELGQNNLAELEQDAGNRSQPQELENGVVYELDSESPGRY